MLSASRRPGAARATPLSRAVRPHLNCCASPTEQQLSRRAALLSGAALPLLRVAPATAAPPVDWAAVKTEILAVISDPASPGGIGERGPTIVRLAWHSSGTYDKITRTNGSGGATIRFTEELSHGANGGLDAPIAWLEPVAAAHPGLSHADLYTLAGATAVEAMGGPHVPWRAGRVDEVDPSKAAPDGRLPAADKGSPPRTAAALREVFGRMGFDDRGIVSLSGAHALGRCHATSSGYVGPWTGTPTIFSNLYFKLLLKQEKDGNYWTPDERMPKLQYKDPSGTLMMLPSDLVLIQDEGFKPFVEAYAKDKKLFYADFAADYSKLLELGCNGLVEVA